MNEKIKFDSMVICSTLNQMVNYIAIKEHDININNIYNITLKEGNKKFNYKKWDENLTSILNGNFESDKIIKYSNKQVSNHKNIVKRLIKKFGGIISETERYPLKEEKILWNITGGQRHFVMAITEYVYTYRPNDVIVYFEGDKGTMYYYTKNNAVKYQDIYRNEEYKMTISIALRLMGFEVSGREIDETSKYYNFLISSSEDEFLKNCKLHNISETDVKDIEKEYKLLDKKFKWYKKFYNIYCNSETLRKLFINSNRFTSDNTVTVFEKIKEDIKRHKEEIYKKISTDIFDEEGFKILEESIGNHKNATVFGYILERMTLYKVLETLKNNAELFNNVADIDISVKIKKDDLAENSKGLIDEFDILIVTKKGKVVMLECKSGGMSGDNAKSHNYSTYAVAGVYGAPILVCPVKEKDNIEKKEKFDTKVIISSKKVCKENIDVYEHVRSARNAAIKANLNICYVNQIKENMEKLIKK